MKFETILDFYIFYLEELLNGSQKQKVPYSAISDKIEIFNNSVEISHGNLINMMFSKSELNYNIVHTLFSLSGRTDAYILKKYKSAYLRYSDDGFYQNTVGERLYTLYGNQIKRSYGFLKDDIFSPDAICFMKANDNNNIDCTFYVHFYYREERLNVELTYKGSHLLEYTNSDLFIYSSLLSLMSHWLGVKAGSLILKTHSIFISERDKERTEKLLDSCRLLKKVDLSLNHDFSSSLKSYREEFSDAINRVITWDIVEVSKRLNNEIEYINNNFTPYTQDLVFILLADRFHRNTEEDKTILDKINNDSIRCFKETVDRTEFNSILEVV